MNREIWHPSVVASVQILSLACEHVFELGSYSRKPRDCFHGGYPASRLMSFLYEELPCISDLDAYNIVSSSDDKSNYYSISAYGTVSLCPKSDILQVVTRKIGGSFEMISPAEDLEWILLTHYEQVDAGSGLPPPFKFINCSTATDCAEASKQATDLSNLIKYAINGGSLPDDTPLPWAG